MFSLEKILLHSREIRSKFVGISYEFRVASIFTHIHSREIRPKFARILYESCTNLVRISCEFRADSTRFPRNLVGWARGMVEICDKCLLHSTGLVPNTMPRPKEPFHLSADRRQRRRLQEPQQVVTKELAAPCTVKYLPDTGKMVLTPETRVVVAVQPEPTMEERSIMAV